MKRIVVILFCVVASVGCHRQLQPSDYELWGVDVSRHQKRVDWEVVAEENKPDFVFLKATEGTLITDPSYARHAKALDKAGILWGAYHFFGHRTSGKAQARNFIRTAKLKKGNLIPVLDIERHRFMKDPKRSVREAKAFCREIHRYYGVNPIIYCSTRFYEHYLQEDFPADKYTLWIADYTQNPHHLDWVFWQHTDSHFLTGIRGGVDRNVFAGDLVELKKLTL